MTWVVRWKDPNTRSWISAAAGKTREEALLVEADIRKKLFRGESPKEKIELSLESKISELVNLFYETPRFQNSTLDWQVVMRRQLQDVILPVFGKKYLSQVKREHLFRFYLDLKSKGLSHSTIGKYHQKFAMLDQLLREINPTAMTAVPSSREFQKLFPKQPPTREINFLTPGELERIYQELRKCRSRLIPIFIRFLASTGMRRSEAIALKWEDVDFESGFIMIRRSKNGSVRKVPLEKETLEVLSKISGAHKQDPNNFPIQSGRYAKMAKESPFPFLLIQPTQALYGFYSGKGKSSCIVDSQNQFMLFHCLNCLVVSWLHDVVEVHSIVVNESIKTVKASFAIKYIWKAFSR